MYQVEFYVDGSLEDKDQSDSLEEAVTLAAKWVNDIAVEGDYVKGTVEVKLTHTLANFVL